MWGRAYNPAWDEDPDAYLAAGVVGWGRSRRLAKLAPPASPFRAYLGVQHVDPGQAGWGSFAAPEARFFVSWFEGARCVALRTAPTMAATRDLLWQAWQPYAARETAAGEGG